MHRFCLLLVSVTAALSLACGDDSTEQPTTSSDDDASDGGSDDDSTADDDAGTGAGPSSGPDSGEADGSTTDDSDTAETSDSSEDSDSDSESTGEPTCEPGLESYDYSEVEGCPEPIGTPFCSEGAEHVQEGLVVDWDHDPPHSGPHYPTWADWGEHAEDIPRGNWVHNLEHGGIVLAYWCGLEDECEGELAVLREVIEARPDLRILMTRDPMLPGERFAALSWTWVYRFDTPDLETLLCFADQHENHAPEDVP